MVFDLYKFDVDLARKIVSDGRDSFELSREDVDHSLNWSRIDKSHIEHVSLEFPGIVAYYWHPEPDGSYIMGSVLIDGHHRAAKAKQTDVPFFVHVLNEEESRAVTMRSPTHQTLLEFSKNRKRKADRYGR